MTEEDKKKLKADLADLLKKYELINHEIRVTMSADGKKAIAFCGNLVNRGFFVVEYLFYRLGKTSPEDHKGSGKYKRRTP